MKTIDELRAERAGLSKAQRKEYTMRGNTQRCQELWDQIKAVDEQIRQLAEQEETEMRYHIVDSKVSGDEFEIAVTEDRDEALKIARDEWDRMTAHDKANSNIEIRIYADEDEQTDYDEVDWWTWYAVMESDEDDDWGSGSYDLDEAKELLTPAGYIAVIDVRSDYCMEEIRFDYDSFRVSAVFEGGDTVDNDMIHETGADAVEAEIESAKEWFEEKPEYYIISYYLDGKNVGEEEIR